MGQIKVTPCHIEGLYVIEPTVHGDQRGYFMETYNQRDMEEAGLTMNLCRTISPALPREFCGAFISRRNIPRENWCV